MRSDQFDALLRSLKTEGAVFKAKADWSIHVKRGDSLLVIGQFKSIHLKTGNHVNYPISQMEFVQKVLLVTTYYSRPIVQQVRGLGIPDSYLVEEQVVQEEI